MNSTGMLWYCDEKTLTAEQRIVRAAEYYSKKYGIMPVIALVPTKQANDYPASVGILQVRPDKSIGRNCIELHPPETLTMEQRLERYLERQA
jgi:hypothetical protein